jgi:hypothetical protein
MPSINNVSNQLTTNIVPVQGTFDQNGNVINLIGPAGKTFIAPIASTTAVLSLDANGNPIGVVNPKDGSTVHSFNQSLDRPPTYLDNSSIGYNVNSVWQAKGQIYKPVGTPDATSSAWGSIQTMGACPADIIGYSATWATSNSIFAGGLCAMIAGYVGALVDISVTIATTPTTFTINCLTTGEIDVLKLQAAMSLADSGTYVTVIKLYDQTGLNNHAVKNASYAAPFIDYDSVMGRYIIATSGYNSVTKALQFPTGVAGTSGFVVAGNSWSMYAVGRALGSCDNANGVLATVGDYLSAPNKFATIQTGSTGIVQRWSTEQSSQYHGTLSFDSQPSVVIVTSGASSTVSINEDTGTSAFAQDAQSYVGGWLFTDQPALGLRQSVMRLAGIVIAKTVLTSAQQQALRYSSYTRFNILPQTKDQVFVIGDSRVSAALPTTVPAETLSMALAKQLGRNYKVYGFGNGGATSSVISTTQLPTVVAKYTSLSKNSAVYLSGVNDFILSALTPAQVLTAIKANLLTLKNAGYTVILINEIATTNTTNNANTNLATLRALITAQGTSGMGCDKIVDLNQYAPFATPANTAYYADGLHPTAALDNLWASALATIIQSSANVITN